MDPSLDGDDFNVRIASVVVVVVVVAVVVAVAV